jgi:hypothetical protein
MSMSIAELTSGEELQYSHSSYRYTAARVARVGEEVQCACARLAAWLASKVLAVAVGNSDLTPKQTVTSHQNKRSPDTVQP